MKCTPAVLFLAGTAVLFTGSAAAQTELQIERPTGGFPLLHAYQAPNIPPINLSNSSRLESLIRAGNLYLTAQDVVALAIENNIDIEVQRYGPLLAREVLKRAKAGGLLRNVGVGVAPGPQSVSLTGVSVTANNLTIAGGGNVNSGGGILTQLGPPVPSLDPTVFAFANFQHATIPQSNTFLTGTTALVQDTRSYQAQYAQNWEFGLSAQVTYASLRTKVNSQFFNLNPYTSGDLDLQVTQNLLQGFGSAVNGRNIRVQKNNLKVTDLQFKQQVMTTVTAALNLYWDLVAFNEDVRARQRALDTANLLLEDNKKQVQLGSLAEIEVTRAEAQVYASQQDLVIARTNVLQQETILKNALSRNGVASPTLAEVHVVPLDTIPTPPAEQQAASVEELVQQALQNRPEIAQSRLNIESQEMNLVGIRSSLKPTLQVFGELTNNGLTGVLSAVGAMAPGAAYLAGGYGNLLAQIARRNFPNYSAGFSLNIPLRNRAAQSDYTSTVLEIRQSQLTLTKSESQVRVDVQNAVIGLQQARARYDAAVKTRVLQEQTLDADRRKQELGASTVYQVVQDQRDLATAESSQTQAMANFTHAQIALDQALGRTLETNHISLDEAMTGRIARPSTLPATLPPAEVKQ
jgi:outer membrane protein TolC